MFYYDHPASERVGEAAREKKNGREGKKTMSIKIFKKHGNANIFRFLNSTGTKKTARGGLSESDIDLFMSCAKPSVMWMQEPMKPEQR